MTQLASEFNPFMLMVNPEIVLAAIEKSERLAQLNSQMCRPLDKIPGQVASNADDGGDEFESDELSA
ncbi:MAG: hypothetical protein M3Y32_11405 [Pseudomonadota bacterium]|nr:hypothetical protein [Pseudomonadota bacterium]